MTKESQRQRLISLLGDLPNQTGKVVEEKIKEEDKGSYILESLLLSLNGLDFVPAYFARPKYVEEKMPVVLYNHSHGGNYHIGKTELIHSSDYLQETSYAEELTNMGYGVLCVDMWGFGERRGLTQTEIYKEMLWKGQVMWGMMIYDSMRAVDYLTAREDVDSTRIATLGMSMGGLMAWWLSAVDERIKVCIDISAQVDSQALLDQRGLDCHGIYYYVPGLLKHFQTSEIQKLIAPRPHLSAVGNYDRLTPFEGLTIIDEALKQIYEKAGKADQWKMVRFNCGHIETAGMRAEVCSFLKKFL